MYSERKYSPAVPTYPGRYRTPRRGRGTPVSATRPRRPKSSKKREPSVRSDTARTEAAKREPACRDRSVRKTPSHGSTVRVSVGHSRITPESRPCRHTFHCSHAAALLPAGPAVERRTHSCYRSDARSTACGHIRAAACAPPRTQPMASPRPPTTIPARCTDARGKSVE